MKKKKKAERKKEREKKIKTIMVGADQACHAGFDGRVSAFFFFFFWPSKGQLLIVETVGEDGVSNGAVMMGLKESEAPS